MLTYFFLLLFFFKWPQCCGCSPYTFKYTNTNVSDYDQTFQWLVVIKDIEDPVFKLSYGALIHPQVALTSALTIDTLSVKDLLVQTNCSIILTWVPTNCIERQVLRVVTFKNKSNSRDYYEHNYILLILRHPFPVDAVEIAGSVNNINQENCYFLRWMREMSQDYKKKQLVTVKYKTSFNDGHLDVSNFDQKQLRIDRDFIISRTFHFIIIHEKIRDQNFLNFLGSPLICQDKENPEYYVLAGIGTFNLRITVPSNKILLFNASGIVQEGSFINIINYRQQILEAIDFKRIKKYSFKIHL